MTIIIGLALVGIAFFIGIPQHLITSHVEWSQVLLLAGSGVLAYGLVEALKDVVLTMLGTIALIGSVALAGYGVFEENVLIIAAAVALFGGWAQGVNWSKTTKGKTKKAT